MATKPTIQWKPAHKDNYTVGRTRPIKYITFHHVVGSDDSAISKFQRAGVQVSAHFVVGDTKITQMVDLKNTAYTNGNWDSNNECITIEHEGDWRFGYRNDKVINNSAKLVAWLRTQYPNIRFNRHRDVKSTVCPGDLPVEQIWNKATELMKPPKPPAPEVPPAPALSIKNIANVKMVTKKSTKLWDLNFRTWAEAKAVKEYPKGTVVEISAECVHPIGSRYLLSEYSYSKGIANGFNAVDLENYNEPTKPPVDPCKEEIDRLTKSNEELTKTIQRQGATIIGLQQTVNDKQDEIDVLVDENTALKAEIKELQSKLALCNEDTDNLNKLGELLRWLIGRLGLKS